MEAEKRGREGDRRRSKRNGKEGEGK